MNQTASGPKAFLNDAIIEIENGSKIRLKKWSVRKAIAMGGSIAKVVGEVVRLIETKADNDKIQIGDIVALVPEVLESCASELSFIIIESTTLEDGTAQIDKDEIWDKLSLDDFVDLLTSIVELNLTEKTMGKWKRLLGATTKFR